MGNLVEIEIGQIIANPYQPRTIFDKDSLQELSQSIRENGLIQPIVVRQALNGKYEIVAGERRFKAACLAGYQKVPCIINEYDNKQSAKVALIENIQRENLTAIEEAEAYKALLEMDKITQSKLALTVGKTQSTIANKLRLLKLPESAKTALRERKITERHARAMLSIDNEAKVDALIEEITTKNLTVMQTEKLINKTKRAKKPTGTTKALTPNVKVALNTIKQACEMIRKHGIDVLMSEKDDDSDYYTITLKVLKVKK